MVTLFVLKINLIIIRDDQRSRAAKRERERGKDNKDTNNNDKILYFIPGEKRMMTLTRILT